MYKFTFLRNSHSTHALAWQLFYRCFIAELTAVPAPAQACLGTLQAQVASGEVEMQWLMLRAEVHCRPLHGPAEWSSLQCQVPDLCTECTSFMSSSNSELTRLRGTAPVLPRKPRFLTAELPHPNSTSFSYPGFPPIAQLVCLKADAYLKSVQQEHELFQPFPIPPKWAPDTSLGFSSKRDPKDPAAPLLASP